MSLSKRQAVIAVLATLLAASPVAASVIAPVALDGIMVGACLIASKFTRRLSFDSGAGGWRPGRQPGSRLVLKEKRLSPTAYYRDLKRLG